MNTAYFKVLIKRINDKQLINFEKLIKDEIERRTINDGQQCTTKQ